MGESQRLKVHYVYILRCADGSFYTGYTCTLQQRLTAHNAGKGGRYTRSHRPVELVAAWSFPTQREALQTEYRIKQLSRKQKLALIQSQVSPDHGSNLINPNNAHLTSIDIVSDH